MIEWPAQAYVGLIDKVAVAAFLMIEDARVWQARWPERREIKVVNFYIDIKE